MNLLTVKTYSYVRCSSAYIRVCVLKRVHEEAKQNRIVWLCYISIIFKNIFQNLHVFQNSLIYVYMLAEVAR